MPPAATQRIADNVALSILFLLSRLLFLFTKYLLVIEARLPFETGKPAIVSRPLSNALQISDEFPSP
jgi:hypothetical protein